MHESHYKKGENIVGVEAIIIGGITRKIEDGLKAMPPVNYLDRVKDAFETELEKSRQVNQGHGREKNFGVAQDMLDHIRADEKLVETIRSPMQTIDDKMEQWQKMIAEIDAYIAADDKPSLDTGDLASRFYDMYDAIKGALTELKTGFMQARSNDTDILHITAEEEAGILKQIQPDPLPPEEERLYSYAAAGAILAGLCKDVKDLRSSVEIS